jgi:hypothetical protein
MAADKEQTPRAEKERLLLRPAAILSDIDGTITLQRAQIDDADSRHEDRAGITGALPNWPVIKTLRLYSLAGYQIILATGRPQSETKQTIAWLDQHGVPYDLLHLRPDEDNRPRRVRKREFYMSQVAPYYQVDLVLDDRPRMVRMWRDTLGLPAFQVNDGPAAAKRAAGKKG